MTFYDGDEGAGVYQDWFECMEHDDKAEFVAYIRTVAARFFSHSSRVRKKGLLLRRSILEIKTDHGWKDILDPGLDR